MVLGVAVLLTGMLLPAMSQLRESAHRIVCSSNQRQLGQALFMYAHDHRDTLPKSQALTEEVRRPQELMSAVSPVTGEWDGWGILFRDQYCAAVECYYCPSHLGEHPIERYYESWYFFDGEPIYTNFHYSGNIEWQTGDPRYLHRGEKLVLATDGLRTASDFNHVTGMNALHGDGAVRWVEDAEEILSLLPNGPIATSEEAKRYAELWSLVEVRR